ncbi:MAG: helix-turn-helix domain-containing protein, partial [Raoultibacter sp.]
EFEFYEEDGYTLAVPFNLEGATFGDGLDDAVQSASDWLYETINDMLVRGIKPSLGSFGNEPLHGGKVIAVSVSCDLSRVDAVTAAEAARMLGVSSARVAQMCETNTLTSWRDGTRRMIVRESLNARLAEKPKAGRPRKEALQA